MARLSLVCEQGLIVFPDFFSNSSCPIWSCDSGSPGSCMRVHTAQLLCSDGDRFPGSPITAQTDVLNTNFNATRETRGSTCVSAALHTRYSWPCLCHVTFVVSFLISTLVRARPWPRIYDPDSHVMRSEPGKAFHYHRIFSQFDARQDPYPCLQRHGLRLVYRR